MRVAVIGAGITGLAAAYRLSQKGYQVVVFEKEKYAGGQAAGFERKNWRWPPDNFFHHLFVSDEEVKKLVAELNLSDKLFYLRPKTSIFKDGRFCQFDSPLSVLQFPYLSFPEKIRACLITAYLRLSNDWEKFEKITACKWLKKYYGWESYKILWQPLLQAKFGKEAKVISMTWFWARIKKRSSRLGYLKGGFQVLINELVKRIEKNGGQIFFSKEIAKITREALSPRDFMSSEMNDYDKVIITTPAEKFFPTKFPKMIGALNLILVLKEKFLTDGTYWLNINDTGYPFVAVVEHTNFVDKKYYGDEHIVYIGGYYPQTHRYFGMTDKEIFKEFLPYLKKINSQFDGLSVTGYELRVNKFAQPIVPTNYSKIIPKFKTSIPNVYLANMQMIYPWDRGINYAIEMGEKVANEIIAGL